MTRTLFGSGAKGEIIRRIQKQLEAHGFYKDAVDGVYGNDTLTAVAAFQHAKEIEPTGEVDDATWQALMEAPIPPVDERCLCLTATFEGHGYTLAQGNFDGAGVTWGIIGFTLKHGELAKIIQEAFAEEPDTVRKAFGEHTDELLAVFRKPMNEQIAWADSISLGKSKATLAEPWKTAFARFGETAIAQRLQLEHVHESYYLPALATAKKFGLKSELSAALCFDIHVQNGGIKGAAEKQIRAAITPGAKESEIRVAIANAVADNALAEWREDVRERKLAIAKGEGSVHGSKPILLRNWGLDDIDLA